MASRESAAALGGELLERVPLFSFLSVAEREAVAALLVETSYRKGDVVCREGDEGTGLFLILTGEVEVLGPGDRLLNRLGPGDYLGEMALLLGSPRSATVRVSRAARLAVLDRVSFERHFMRNPKVIEHFARILGQRLAVSHRPEVAQRRSVAIAVLAAPKLVGKTLVAFALAGFLRDLAECDVLVLRIHPPGRGSLASSATLVDLARGSSERLQQALHRGGADPVSLDVELSGSETADELVDACSRIVARLEEHFPYLVVDAPSGPVEAVEAIQQSCDEIVRIVDRAGPRAPGSTEHRVLDLCNPRSEGGPNVTCDPYFVPYEAGLAPKDPRGALAYLRQYRDSTASRSLRRLARKLLGRTLGLAVGGGAAFGISHVGVLEVFERHEIEVDLVAGTSMGSIVAAGLAAGMTPLQMREIAARLGTVPTTLSALDFTLTRPGLLAGRRIVEIFSPLLGAVERFEDLRLPCQLVATDIRSGERVALASGRLDTAFRASCSVPMLWSPVRHEGRVLVDGGVVDPVPAELVLEMGADICIAVNVVPPLREGVETVISRLYRQLNVLNPLSYLGDARGLPNTLDVMMNSIQMLQHELGNFKSISADVRIVPDLSEFTWIEFYRALELVDRGAEAAEKAMPEVKRVLAERAAHPKAAAAPL